MHYLNLQEGKRRARKLAGIDMEKSWGGPGAEDSHTSAGCLANIDRDGYQQTRNSRVDIRTRRDFPDVPTTEKYRVSREGEEE